MIRINKNNIQKGSNKREEIEKIKTLLRYYQPSSTNSSKIVKIFQSISQTFQLESHLVTNLYLTILNTHALSKKYF
jgi:hypothetical protein